MGITFDPDKNIRNIELRNLSFDKAAEFGFVDAIYLIDNRHDYNEVRHIAIGYLDGRLHHLCFVETAMGIRVISFRKANAREAKRHGKAQTIDG
ncbi:MAG: BrnT family toxin [Sulfuriferula sp.]